MKAVVQERYGPPEEVLAVRDIEMPPVGDNEVRVRVRAASMHPDVWHGVTGLPLVLRLMGSGVRRPKQPVPGTDLAGHVEATGKNVSRFRVGDDVFGESVKVPWAFGNGGTFAEYATVGEELLALKPANVTFEQAAAVTTSGWVTLATFRAGGTLGPGHHVLINGAGGCVGSIAVQLAKASGMRVTAVDRASKLDMILALGADRVVDYARDNPLQRGERYDFIYDVASTLSFPDCKRALTPTGVYWRVGHEDYCRKGRTLVGRSMPSMFGLMMRLPFDRNLPRLDLKSLPTRQAAVSLMQGLLAAGKLAPIVSRTFSLDEVPAAIRCLQEGCAPGRIVISS